MFFLIVRLNFFAWDSVIVGVKNIEQFVIFGRILYAFSPEFKAENL